MKYDVEALLMVTEEELNEIQGVGEVLAKAFTGYFSDAKHVENFRKLLEELTIPEETSTKKQILKCQFCDHRKRNTFCKPRRSEGID